MAGISAKKCTQDNISAFQGMLPGNPTSRVEIEDDCFAQAIVGSSDELGTFAMMFMVDGDGEDQTRTVEFMFPNGIEVNRLVESLPADFFDHCEEHGIETRYYEDPFKLDGEHGQVIADRVTWK